MVPGLFYFQMKNSSDNFYIQSIRKVEAGSAVDRIHFLDDVAAFILGNGDILLQTETVEPSLVTLFEGALLTSAASNGRLIAGGDDGRIIEFSAARKSSVVATDSKHRWIDHVCTDESGAVAWAAGKQAFLQEPGGEVLEVDLPSSVGGLALTSERFGVAHYNGITLLERNTQQSNKTLAFDGMHTEISFHPDGDFVVTRMRDPALHAWCLREGGEHVMEGYSAAVRSISWSSTGHWLATSGARYLALWPVRQAQNPLSNVPVLLAGYRAVSTAVACHPTQPVVAVGYEDGAVLLIRIEDEAEILLKNAAKAPVSALLWKQDGSQLAIGCEDGTGRVIRFATS